ncbi:MAG: ABC transporter ATP-binding protein/permease [Candidatus Adiutrix sp.]|jgi:ABC-type multidrug transport system fused ATPase/permease subunit|nr:ABC transporter ATP-binding protein/permease [Candidatus Adiutrix sp.]
MNGKRNITDDEVKRPINGGDLKLLARLWPLLKPLRFLILAGAALVLFAALASVALPYATKLALDRYIVPVGPRAELAAGQDAPEPLRRALDSGEVVQSGQDGVFFLQPEALSLLDAREERALTEAGILTRERYYVRPAADPGGAELLALSAEHPGLVSRYPALLAVEEKNLAALPNHLTALWRGADMQGLSRLAIIFSLIMAVGYAFEFGQRVLLETAAQRLSLSLRQNLLEHLFGLSQSFFDRNQSARLTSRVTNDVNNLSNLTKTTVATLFNDLISLVAIVAIMFSLSPKLALITVAFTPLTVILSSYFGRLSRAIQRDLRARLAIINQSFAETIGGISIIQAFRREERNAEMFGNLNYENYLAGVRQIRIHAVFVPMIDVFASIILALVIWYGGGAVLAGTLSLGVVAAFIGYARRFFMPIQDMAEKLNLFQSAFASLERLTELLDENEKIEEAENPVTPIKPGGGVEFAHVNFRYLPEGPLVLKDIHFKIAPGEAVALVGQTGSGKSSIINLIQRGYDPESGEILFDGQPLKSLDLTAHRARLGLVTQDVYLYAGTVLENLRLGRDRLSDDDIKAACRAVGADQFIEKLPHGYEEQLGAGGRHLSVGERQLLACARALIETPEIIILDEATAAVDSETEALIEKALRTLFTGRTSITIAHRLATIRRVDRILVLHNGQLIEQGSHRELIEKKGAYYRLALLQGLA